jgi:hypothetical protein
MMETPVTPPVVANKDEEHLKLLATFHYVIAVLGGLFACLPLLHVGMGVMMIAKPEVFNQGQNVQPAPAWAGYMFIVMGGFFVLLGWATSICTFLSGRYLAQRRKRMFSFVMAAILCMFVPFGTVLGVFTIIVLSRDSVQRLYEKPA